MGQSIIHKFIPDLRVPPNLSDYEGERSQFSWAQARTELATLPGGGINIAHNAVTRHARGPLRDRLAFRFLSGENVRELTYGDLAVVQLKAVARALEEFPQLNGFFADGAFRPAPTAHIGVAISLRQGGLVAPALHDVAAKDLPRLMQELTDMVARARAWKLRGSELSDPTITVTNLGDQGVEAVFGIITPPQVALVGFGRVAFRPWVGDDRTVTAIPTVTASLAADHRVTDGHTGAMFLAALHDWLQRPEDL